MNLDALKNAPRFLMEVGLKPVQGQRFQPTGFPNLGAAVYVLTDGRQMLLLESAQSMANHLEKSCWDENAERPIGELDGMPYVESTLPDGQKTNSLLEAHRVNSPYIVNSKKFAEIETEIGFKKSQPFDRQKLVKALFKYDPNSLIHGVFLEKVGGVVRLPRALSAFIEASNVTVAASGGAKIDRVQPGTKEGDQATFYGKAADGYGNVPFPRDEYTGDIKAYFNIDLALIDGFQLPSKAKEFLITLALLKIQRFLYRGLRLRTACDLEVTQVTVTHPHEWPLPSREELEASIQDLIANEALPFVTPFKTEVLYDAKVAKAKEKQKENERKVPEDN